MITLRINCTKGEFVNYIKSHTIPFKNTWFYGVSGFDFKRTKIQSSFEENSFTLHLNKSAGDIFAPGAIAPKSFWGEINECSDGIVVVGYFEYTRFARISPLLPSLGFLAMALFNDGFNYIFFRDLGFFLIPCIASALFFYCSTKLYSLAFKKEYNKIADFLNEVADFYSGA